MITLLALSAMFNIGLLASKPEGKEHGTWPAGSAMQVGDAHNKRTEELENEIEVRLRELLELVADGVEKPDERVLRALEAEQNDWSHHRDSSCELVGATTGAGGAWPSAYAAECKFVLTERRLKGIESCLVVLEKLPPNVRQWNITQCVGLKDVLPAE